MDQSEKNITICDMMYMLKSALVAFALSITMAGCGNGARPSEGEIVIELSDGDSEINYRDVISVEGWIELSNDIDATVSLTTKYMEVDGKFYVLERTRHCVLVFGNDGTFIGVIGKKGGGPGEYPAVYDFAVNQDSDEIALLSRNSEVYVYDLDGKFKSHHKLTDAEITGIEYCDGRYIATTSYSAYPVSGQDSYLLYQFDTDFDCTARWIPYQQPLHSAFSPIVIGLRRVGDEIYYVDNAHMCIIKVPDKPIEAPIEIIQYACQNAMPIGLFKDMNGFLARQRDYDWIMEVIPTKDMVLAGWVSPGAYNVSITKWNGEQVKSGPYIGMPIGGRFGSDGYIYTMVMPDEYLDIWKSRNVINPEPEPTEDSNALMLKWRIAKME